LIDRKLNKIHWFYKTAAPLNDGSAEIYSRALTQNMNYKQEKRTRNYQIFLIVPTLTFFS